MNTKNDPANTSNYLFSVSLFNASTDPNTPLELWQSGTLDVNLSGKPAVTGVLNLSGFYSEPIPFSGGIQPAETGPGTIVSVAGQTSQVQISITAEFEEDGFLYEGTYIAGLVSMLDFSAQETYLYVLQGLSPQSALGKAFRGGSSAPDKRKRSVPPQRSS